MWEGSESEFPFCPFLQRVWVSGRGTRMGKLINVWMMVFVLFDSMGGWGVVVCII